MAGDDGFGFYKDKESERYLLRMLSSGMGLIISVRSNFSESSWNFLLET